MFVNSFTEFSSDGPQEVPFDIASSKDQIALNIPGIAEVCSCSSETVTQFLYKLREQVLNQVLQKKKNVSLNLIIG